MNNRQVGIGGLALLAALATTSHAASEQALSIERALARVPLHDPKPLHSQERRRIVLDVYSRSGGLPVWLAGGQPTRAAHAAAAALAGIGARGLDPADYADDYWPQRLSEVALARPGENLSGDIDVALTRDLAHAACDLLFGRIDPALVGFEYPWPPDDVDLAGAILTMAKTGRISEQLDALEPDYAAFHRLGAQLPRYLELAARWGAGEPIDPGGTTLHPGESSARLAPIARLLTSLGDLAPADEAAAARSPYGVELEAALRRFQERQGLLVDGVIGRDTQRELRTPLPRRVRQIELTLERWRWLPRRFTQPLLLVNIPAFRLSAFEAKDGVLTKVFESRVIVGREYRGRRTPLLASRLTELVFNPWWEVPRRIAREEVLPALLKDPSRAGRQGYVIERAGEELPLDAVSAALVRSGKARIRQRPGPENLLGGVRFVFPNDFATYLHGTPARQLFERSDRALSHGCIRVEEPLALALHVLREDPSWNREQVEGAMASGKTLHVPLSRNDWVLIVYGTASAREDGSVRFFRDVYGQDARLEAALSGVLLP